MSFNVSRRSDVVAFYGVKGSNETVTYNRMVGFTELSTSKNPIEYSRQYVDEDAERTDITGYSPEISYNFDEVADNPVHQDLVSIEDDEVIGSAATREIIMVYLNREATTPAGSFEARRRTFTVVPDTSGDTTDAMTHSGTFRANGVIEKGTATSADGWQTVTFTADSDAD